MNIDILILANDESLVKEATDNIKEYFGKLPLVLYNAPSIANGYNRLAKMSTADILCFIHQDARILFTLDKLITYFQNLKNPGILGFCGTNKQIPGKQWHECSPRYGSLIQGKAELSGPLVFSQPDNNYKTGELYYQPIQTMDGYCLFMLRSVYEQLGGFDEEHTNWHGYDIDICAKALSAGYQNYVIYQPSTHYSWGSSGPGLDNALTRFREKWQTMFDNLNQDKPVKLDEPAKPDISKPIARKIPAPARPRKGRLKICVYTIARNELQFCERFAKSCEDADGVYVLDTGSTDGTPEELAKYGVDVEVLPFNSWKTLEEYDKLMEEGKNPWRFDVARNLNMDMVPEDADVLVSIDLDEVLVPGWRKIIESKWVPGINHLSYFFAWSMENGKPRNCFWYEKIHSRHGYVWAAPVHEAIVPIHGFTDHRASTTEVLVHHYPDGSKSRSQYLHMLELGVRESPHCPRLRFYLGREYTYNLRYQDAINSHTHLLSMSGSTCARERSNACLQIASCHGALKDAATVAKNNNLIAMHNKQQFHWLLKAVMEEDSQRESWVELADYCRLKGDNLLGYWAAKKALNIPETACDGNYLVDPESWKQKPHDLASLMGWYVGDNKFKEESLQEAWIALSYCPFDGRLESNYRIIQNCLAKPVEVKDPLVDIIILSYSKTEQEYNMTKQAIQSLRASSPAIPMRFIVIETNKQLAQENFTRADAGKLFGSNIEVCFPNTEFEFNTYLNAGYKQLNEVASPAKYQVVMNNDVVLFNPDFMVHMLNGLRSVPSASPLGLREATWGLVNRSVPIDENYDINRSVNGWFLMFDKKILNAIPFEQLFPPEFTFYGGDIHYAESLEKFGYKHGLINAAQALHLQKQSHKLIEAKPESVSATSHLPSQWSSPAPTTMSNIISAKLISSREEMLKFIDLKNKDCVEVGVERGMFAQSILNENPKSLLLVDPWQHQDESTYKDINNVSNDEFERKYQECKLKFGNDPRVTLCRSFSVQAAKLYSPESLDFVYIDAIHTKEAVTEDINTWWPLIKLNGWLCGHDYQFADVAEAVIEFINKNNLKLDVVTTETGPATSWGLHKVSWS